MKVIITNIHYKNYFINKSIKNKTVTHPYFKIIEKRRLWNIPEIIKL